MDEADALRVLYEAAGIAKIRMVTASISTISSIGLIILLSRSENKFTTTPNRLLLGLSIADIMSSVAFAFVTLPMPVGTWNAWITLGNTTTCEIQVNMEKKI